MNRKTRGFEPLMHYPDWQLILVAIDNLIPHYMTHIHAMTRISYAHIHNIMKSLIKLEYVKEYNDKYGHVRRFELTHKGENLALAIKRTEPRILELLVVNGDIRYKTPDTELKL